MKGGKDMKFLQKKFVLVLLLILFVFPHNAISGSPGPTYLNPETDNASFQLYYYWDLRDRESTFQVFNRGSSVIRVHVQVFVANSSSVQCAETDFFDQYTPFDTHIYNLSNLTSNNGSPTGVSSFPDNTFGFAVVTVVNSAGSTLTDPVLQGSFRITDNAGYEYRANPAGIKPIGFTTDSFGFSYETMGPNTRSDVIGIPVIWTEPTFGIPLAGPHIVAKFQTINVEDPLSLLFNCAPNVFSCSTTGMNKGINDSIPNSKDSSRMCSTNINTGTINFELPIIPGLPSGTIQADFLVGFVGINNGSNIGSMDAFIAIP